MANDKDKSAPLVTAPKTSPDKSNATISPKCSVCCKVFSSVQECFKHELLEHSFQRKKSSKSGLDNRLNATQKFLNSKDKLDERKELHNRLEKCPEGQELRAIFEQLCMKTDSLGLIFTRIQTCLEKEIRPAGNAKIYPFGSIASGLALRDCDIDIFLDASDINHSPKHQRQIQKDGLQSQHRSAFNRINHLLQRSPHFMDVFPIRGARVPIIKCKHKDTGFSIDINVSCPSSKENTQFIYELVKSDERIHELLLFIKLWAKHMQIIGRANMTSYCLITMVVFFLQQPWRGEKDGHGFVKSVKKLQENCAPHMVQGINYAFNLRSKQNQPQIPPEITTWELIKEFFKFYENYNFEENIISPFYGETVEKSKLTEEICQEYRKQLRTITQFLQGTPADNFQIDRCMCVQDSFCLNHNVAKTMLPPNKQYFILCLRNANTICENLNNLKISQLYEQLLYETITINKPASELVGAATKEDILLNLKNIQLPSSNVNAVNEENSKNLLYTLIPSKADLRTLACADLTLSDNEEILRFWCQHYVSAIKTIINEFYRIDMQIQSPAQQKQQKMDTDNIEDDLNQTYLLSTSVDLWTNRFFQKSSQTTFKEYQLEQTERLHNLRRQDPKFSVHFNALLTLNILPDYMGIAIKMELPDSTTNLCKKSPLRKFYNMFKNTLQNYNLKEALKSDNPNNKSGIGEDNKIKTSESNENDDELKNKSNDFITAIMSTKNKAEISLEPAKDVSPKTMTAECSNDFITAIMSAKNKIEISSQATIDATPTTTITTENSN